MKSNNRFLAYLLVFVLGALVTYFVVNWTKNTQQKEASHTIAYGIKRLNKMVVAEQEYSNFYSHKSTTQYLGDLISFDKNLLLEVRIKATASYDLSKMVVKVDSANETIYIEKIPPVKIELSPDVEFSELNQSMLNQFSKEDLNGIKQRAIKEVEKTINDTELREKAHEQLLTNLEELYLLAKIYGWKVVDKTGVSISLENKIKF